MEEPSGYPGYNGDVFYYDSFLDLHPAAGGTSGRGTSTTWVYPVIVVVVVAAAVGIVVLRRRRRGPETEAEE